MQTTINLNNRDHSLDGKYQNAAEHLLILCDSTYGAYTIQLPDCTLPKYKEFMFKNMGPNAITITCFGYQTIFVTSAVTSHVMAVGEFFSVRTDLKSQYIALV